MEVTRVKCRECGVLILPLTAAKYHGYCAPCGDMTEETRRERREYAQQLESGAVFTPSALELASARTPEELRSPATVWTLEPDYYADQPDRSVPDVISSGAHQPSGNVFLVSTSGGRLHLSFTEQFGVCEYQHEEAGDWRYASTLANLRQQVAQDQHVVQACPCCGEGMLWFPSRFHMPRDIAFGILASLAANRAPPDVEWLETGDISRTSRGRG